MRLQTVNVIEYDIDNSSIIGITSFSDDDDGNREAEKFFLTVIKENSGTESDREVAETENEYFLEEGYFQMGSYQTFITHS